MPGGNGDLGSRTLFSADASDFRSMSVERDIRFDLIARLCPNTTGAELRSVATEVRSSYPTAVDVTDVSPCLC